MLTIEYCARAIIRHLNGDLKLFESYRDKAIETYHREQCICSIEEMIPDRTKKKLYKLVN
ncbi:hypothetical protein FYJ27_05300 [Anaerosalibacter bizertensis]|uniref:Uncharacterized protein n=1 Tax=Anaerosalibacter bizertensis TaxID=932217 RepID=A0A844FGR0_9FIRM|nr:hypothetical protein [Anaerosalibacter bizertensis]MBU5292801.1 hypothetical protein [Anaerosalibacter bizertensis]MSS43148.1 hypothetical protein [Anaerosalibacter bizertensis]HHV27403.1 hypothetical protein [Tissierellia bacterium]